VYTVLVGKSEGKRPLGRPRRRWKDGIKMDLREIGWGCGVDSSGWGQGSLPGCLSHVKTLHTCTHAWSLQDFSCLQVFWLKCN
jgi:hypothetical protein